MELQISGWVTFAIVVLGLLALDLGIFHRRPHAVALREALGWSLVWVVVAFGFAGLIWFRSGLEPTLEFLTGYLIEKSLSIDNIFVFLLCFQAFRVPTESQHKVLFWGVLGALLMRAVLVAAGISLLQSFHWLTYVFGGFLVVTGIKLASRQGEPSDPTRNFVVRFARRFLRVTDDYEGSRFVVRRNGILWATPLLLVLLCVETTDLIFAVDSIPAILAVTDDPFIVYTSNVFALLGMRALFFAVQGLLLRFRYLNQGLAAVLVFVGIKMAMIDIYKIPAGVALVVIVSILAATMVLSVVIPERRREAAPGKLATADETTGVGY